MRILIPEYAKDVVDRVVPVSVRRHFVPLIEEAYIMAKTLIEQTPFLNNDLGKNQLGDLKVYAIWHLFMERIKEGLLENMDFRIASNRNNSHKYLELHTRHAVITISQTQHKNQTARPAFFRAAKQYLNQLMLNLYEDDPDFQIVIPEKYYLLLTHGYGADKPNFVNLGIPDGKKWVYKIDLMADPHVLQYDLPREEVITLDKDLIGLKVEKFKHFLREKVGNSGPDG